MSALWQRHIVCGLLTLGSYTVLGQSPPQSVRLASITVLDEFGHVKTIGLQPKIHLNAYQNYLAFRFQASRSLPIQYKLDGLDNDWIEGISTDQVRYANLSGGAYTFHLKDQKTGHVETISIQLDMPVWKMWWFAPALFLYIISVIGLVFYLFLQYRFRQKLRGLHVRENIARDLHDDMGSYLSSISMLSQSVLNIAQKDPQHARLLVDKIGETARQVMDSMSDIIWSVNPDNDSMSQIVVRMRDVATDLLGDQDSSLHMNIDEAVSQTQLPLEQRRDFFLIYKEALTNIAKYASASHVWIRLQRNGPTLVLTMQDDGVGFDTSQSVGRNPLGGNGLKNMRARAEKLGGTLTIQSEPGQGTVITLRISVT